MVVAAPAGVLMSVPLTIDTPDATSAPAEPIAAMRRARRPAALRCSRFMVTPFSGRSAPPARAGPNREVLAERLPACPDHGRGILPVLPGAVRALDSGGHEMA